MEQIVPEDLLRHLSRNTFMILVETVDLIHVISSKPDGTVPWAKSPEFMVTFIHVIILA